MYAYCGAAWARDLRGCALDNRHRLLVPQMSHSLFAPSAASRWIACPGSMAFPENQEQGGGSTFADDGTATHAWAALCLQSGKDAALFLGSVKKINGKEYILDEERADRIQGYVDDVHQRAIGGYLLVEQAITLSDYLGEGQGGTADAVIGLPESRRGVIEDLKDGSGEKVYASYQTPEGPAPNPQLALYALGALPMLELFGPIDEFLLVIYQPKLNHVDEFLISVGALKKFGMDAKFAVSQAGAAMVSGPEGLATAGYLNPGEKQCRWCRAKARCPALAKKVSEEVRCDFETIASDTAPQAPRNTEALAKALYAVPLIEDWCRAVRAEVGRLVTEGTEVIGPDGKPYKFVEGRSAGRKWLDEKQAEAALVAQLGPKAFTEPKILTAPAAGKLLDKKATKQLWKDLFEPMIGRPPGAPTLALGSDPRPPFSGAAAQNEFEELGE